MSTTTEPVVTTTVMSTTTTTEKATTKMATTASLTSTTVTPDGNQTSSAQNQTTTTILVTSTEETSLSTPSVQPTGSSYTTRPTSESKESYVIAGAVVGAVVVVVIIAVVVFFCRRRRLNRKRNSLEAKFIPAKDDLEKFDTERINRVMEANEHYGNVDVDGEIKPDTDPAVGVDGYLKKEHGYVQEQSKGKHKKKKNGLDKREAKNRSSVPREMAPSPPIEESNTGVLGKSSSKVGDKHDTGYTDGRIVGENVLKAAYVNLDGQTKGGPVFGVSPKPRTKAKSNQASSNSKSEDIKLKESNVLQPNADKTEYDDKSAGVYENTGSQYANMKQSQYYNEGIVASSPDQVEEVVYEDESM